MSWLERMTTRSVAKRLNLSGHTSWNIVRLRFTYVGDDRHRFVWPLSRGSRSIHFRDMVQVQGHYQLLCVMLSPLWAPLLIVLHLELAQLPCSHRNSITHNWNLMTVQGNVNKYNIHVFIPLVEIKIYIIVVFHMFSICALSFVLISTIFIFSILRYLSINTIKHY